VSPLISSDDVNAPPRNEADPVETEFDIDGVCEVGPEGAEPEPLVQPTTVTAPINATTARATTQNVLAPPTLILPGVRA
jgi:hypothetical protein